MVVEVVSSGFTEQSNMSMFTWKQLVFHRVLEDMGPQIARTLSRTATSRFRDCACVSDLGIVC